MIYPKPTTGVEAVGKDATIIEFKVKSRRRETTLKETVSAALRQIEEKNYAAELITSPGRV